MTTSWLPQSQPTAYPLCSIPQDSKSYHRPGTLRDRDDYLLQRARVRLQLLIARGNPVELENKGDDVDIGLIVQTARISERHRTANLLKPVCERLSLPTELERTLGEVGSLRIGAVEIFPMTPCALCLKGTLAAFRLLGSKYAACG
jgi:hypothetical protein